MGCCVFLRLRSPPWFRIAIISSSLASSSGPPLAVTIFFPVAVLLSSGGPGGAIGGAGGGGGAIGGAGGAGGAGGGGVAAETGMASLGGDFCGEVRAFAMILLWNFASSDGGDCLNPRTTGAGRGAAGGWGALCGG